MTKTKRFISLLLICACVLVLAPAAAPRANAYAAALPLPELTGNTAQDVANIALSQVGYAEVDGGSVYGAWWSTQTGWGVDYTYLGWCSMFANWCAYQAGAGMGVAYNKHSAVVANSMSFLKQNGTVDTSFATAPQPGDFIFFGYSSGSLDHVAIVVDYNSATNLVTFVGGNQGNKVTKYTIQWSSSARYGSQRIIGYGRPNYTNSPVKECGCDPSYAGTYYCTTTSDPLNIRSGHGTSYGIVGNIPSGAKVTVTKADGKWAHVEYNGTRGYASMEYLSKTPAPSGEGSLVEKNGDLYYMRGGKLDSSFSGLAKTSGGKWLYVEKGKVTYFYTGLAKNEEGWWFVRYGEIDYGYEGVAGKDDGMWYVRKGKVDTSFSGTVTVGGITFQITQGKAAI